MVVIDDILPAPDWTSTYPRDKASDDTTIELQVDVVIGADGYRFYGSETPGFTPGGGNLLVSQASNAYDHTGLDIGDTWYYRVRAFNSHVEGLIGDEGSATVLVRIPGVPTMGTVTFLYGSLQATVPWSAGSPDTATLYRIQSNKGACGSGFEGWVAAGTDAASPNVQAVLEGYSYKYRVRGENSAGDSAYSAESNTIVTAQAPNAPTGLTATKSVANPESEIDIAWTDPTTGTLDDVEIHRAATEFGSYSLRQTVAAGAEAWTDTVGDGETWWYKARGKNDCGIGPGSFGNADDATTDVAPPADPPANITVTPKQGTDHQVEVDYDAVTDASSYEIYLALSTMGADPTVGGTHFTPDPSTPGPITIDVSSLISAGADDQVFANVRASNAGGDGPWGTEADGYTHVDTPLLTNPTQDTGDCPSITFDLSFSRLNTDSDSRTGAITIQRDDGAGYSTIHTTGTTDTTYQDTGASLSTVGYRVQFSGESTWSTRSVSPLCPE